MGTLAEGDQPSMVLCLHLDIIDVPAFGTVKRRAKQDDGDEILTYLGMLAEKANTQKSDVLSIKKANDAWTPIPYLVVLTPWFDRIDNFAVEALIQN